MITAERRPITVIDRQRARVATRPAPPAVPADVESSDGTGLLLAFVVATLLMVLGITLLALLESWWLLAPVVLVHWIATYAILTRLHGLLAQ